MVQISDDEKMKDYACTIGATAPSSANATALYASDSVRQAHAAGAPQAHAIGATALDASAPPAHTIAALHGAMQAHTIDVSLAASLCMLPACTMVPPSGESMVPQGAATGVAQDRQVTGEGTESGEGSSTISSSQQCSDESQQVWSNTLWFSFYY